MFGGGGDGGGGGGGEVVVGRYAVLQLCVCLSMSE